jgi:hypothetical protein
MFTVAQGLILTLMLAGAAPRSEGGTDPAIKDFTERVHRYWDLHEKADKAAAPIDKKKEPDPAAIVEHERQLATAIREDRKDAKEGDIFTPAVQKVLVATIQQELASGRGAKAREMILGEGNPKNPESRARVVMAVNAKYPASAPLSTVPPSVLLKLPKLPQGLEYRFVGRDLMLFDSQANLIVDILRNAIR